MSAGTHYAERFGKWELIPVFAVLFSVYAIVSFCLWLNGYYRLGRRPFVAFLPDAIVIRSRVRRRKLKRMEWAVIHVWARSPKWDERKFLERRLAWRFLHVTPDQLEEMCRALRLRLTQETAFSKFPQPDRSKT